MNERQIDSKAKDTGLAAILIFLIISHFTENIIFMRCGIAILVVCMVWPKAFYPLSIVWFGLSEKLGNVVSRILLSIVFVLIVTPVGLIRRLFGADSLKRKEWKKDKNSVFNERNHLFVAEDLNRPF